jgi:ssDNA-binding Zn-finger/Zn-ribbon topoisomerase 1
MPLWRQIAELQERQHKKDATGRETEPAKTVLEKQHAQDRANACPYCLADVAQGEGFDAPTIRLGCKVRTHGRLKECTAQPAQKGCPQCARQRMTETEEQKTSHAQGAASSNHRFVAEMVRQDTPNHAEPLLAESTSSVVRQVPWAN